MCDTSCRSMSANCCWVIPMKKLMMNVPPQIPSTIAATTTALREGCRQMFRYAIFHNIMIAWL